MNSSSSSQFQCVRRIGRGAYGVVYHAIWRQQHCAAKEFHLALPVMHHAPIQREISILRRLQHKHIIQFYDTYEDDGRFYLIMDLAEKGSLSDVITKRLLDWPTKIRLAHEIARGLQYIHSERILHRDLKSSNVLLTKHMEVKLCDFGFATIASVTATQTGSGMGTLRWMAPELLSAKPIYSTKSDMYALGMVMWEMAANSTRPFRNHNNDTMIAMLIGEGEREELPRETPDEYRQWVVKCWNHDRSQRPEASDIVLVRQRPDVKYQNGDVTEFSVSSTDTMVAAAAMHDNMKGRQKAQMTGGAPLMASHGKSGSISASISTVSSHPSFSQGSSNQLSRAHSSGSNNQLNRAHSSGSTQDKRFQGSNAQDIRSHQRINSSGNNNSNTQDKNLNRLESRARRPLSRDLLSLDVDALNRMIERSDTQALDGLVERYRKAAAGGDTEAQTILGWAYDNGRGVRQNGAEAALWYRRAADQGSIEAQVNLGSLYLSGRGVMQSDAEAATWYRKAALSGSTTAQNNLGWMHESGVGVPHDYAKAASWYRMAADRGDSAAQQRLGDLYSKGLGVAKSDTEAARWYRKAAGQGQ